MVKLSDSQNASRTPLAAAQELASFGLQVFPARYRDKFTLVKWEKYQNEDASSMLPQWFKGTNQVNFWVLTGRQSGYVVVDCDSPAGRAWWRERLGDEMERTAVVETAKGHHYWFKIPEDWTGEIASWGVHPRSGDDHDISFDFRADRTGVIVPPSIHESGKQYHWERSLSEALDAPPALLDGTYREDAQQATGDAGDGVAGTGGQTRSMLSRLLAQPPGAEGSGRNDWLARVAGHYAKTYHNQKDLFAAHCEAANRMMDQPLEEDEFTKTTESVWRGEHERNAHRSLDASSGYLQSGDTLIMCQVIVREGDQRDYQFVEYADFDLDAQGVMLDEAGRRTYVVDIVRRDRRDPDRIERIPVVMKAEVLGDERALRKFLAGYACTVVQPKNIYPDLGSIGVRLQRYLESQQPPNMRVTPALGYDPDAVKEGVGGYVTHDGVITKNGLVAVGKADMRVDPRLRANGTAPFEYGFSADWQTAQRVLHDVLQFHHDEVTSVFGAWWAACLLKPQIMDRTSLFPFMAVEAPSESGKTNGFFAMMMQMQGNLRGASQPTKAALRDMSAAHRNAAPWVDDLDDPAYLTEFLRASTSSESMTKMSEDRESVKNTQIVSPIIISGEALGMGTQKALVDRSITLRASSPTRRMSASNPTRAQWDDILDLRAEFPKGLHVLAGWYVREALNLEDFVIGALHDSRPTGAGRAADKVAILRTGARLLDALLGQDDAWEGRGVHAGRVDSWVQEQALVDSQGAVVNNDENALTLEMLPWALREWKYPDKPQAYDKRDMDAPVYVKGFDPTIVDESLIPGNLTVGFSAALMAQAWEERHRGRVERRTTSEEALRDQARAIGAKNKRVKISGSNGRLAYYYQIEGELAREVVRRALGDR